jgi:hypothetical protein
MLVDLPLQLVLQRRKVRGGGTTISPSMITRTGIDQKRVAGNFLEPPGPVDPLRVNTVVLSFAMWSPR